MKQIEHDDINKFFEKTMTEAVHRGKRQMRKVVFYAVLAAILLIGLGIFIGIVAF